MGDLDYESFEGSEGDSQEDLERAYRDIFGLEYQEATERANRRARAKLKKEGRGPYQERERGTSILQNGL